jgi:plastocyanin
MRQLKRDLLAAAALGAAVAVVPAVASSESSPTVSGLESIMWSPAEVTVMSGGTVTFQNTSESVPHGVVWEAGNPEIPVCSGVPIDRGATNWKGSCTFTKPGTYKYYCYVHGMAMSGTIEVSSPSTTTTPTTTTPTTTPGSGATTPPPTVSMGEAGSGQMSPSPLVASPAQAIEFARTQHGKSVRGSLRISQAGVGARLEVDLLASGASLAKAGHPTQVRVGRLVRSSLQAGSTSFAVPLNAKGRAALRRQRRLLLTVKITLTPVHAMAVTATRIVLVHA